MKTDKYEADNGQNKYFSKVVANELIIHGGKNGSHASEEAGDPLPEEITF